MDRKHVFFAVLTFFTTLGIAALMYVRPAPSWRLGLFGAGFVAVALMAGYGVSQFIESDQDKRWKREERERAEQLAREQAERDEEVRVMNELRARANAGANAGAVLLFIAPPDEVQTYERLVTKKLLKKRPDGNYTFPGYGQSTY